MGFFFQWNGSIGCRRLVIIVAPYFQNQSCDPYTARDKRCLLGNYASYSINISSVKDIQTGIRFAQSRNIRLNLKNTGHDILGKSTGKGALSLWLHNFKGIQFEAKCNRSSSYTGPCARFGAGVILDEAYAAMHARGFALTGGTCPTVGISGGFTSGGGHGVLASTHGLAADNILEWEVVIANGSHIYASPEVNSDLYWALSGGGPGTFAVVVSVTMRVYPDEPVTAASFSLDNTTVGDDDRFWDAVTTFHSSLPPVVSAGGTVSFLLSPTTLTAFNIAIPNDNLTQASLMIKIIQSRLEDQGFFPNISATTFPGFLDMYNVELRSIATNTPAAQMAGGRLIPKGLISDTNASKNVTLAFREAVEAGFNILCVAVDVSKRPPYPNSVLPAWRSSLMTCLIQSSWNFEAEWQTELARQEILNKRIMPRIEAATPNAGTYLNEASAQQHDWQTAFYGSNYKSLSAIKSKYDPLDVFYAATAVGSERWTSDNDGRLCRS
ncbi:FAD-binding domain-containing protein [Xylariaceae sp. FL1019]|nr:FAD-binding domain-containing protein [Xylariaceae sp. FL1019]